MREALWGTESWEGGVGVGGGGGVRGARGGGHAGRSFASSVKTPCAA